MLYVCLVFWYCFILSIYCEDKTELFYCFSISLQDSEPFFFYCSSGTGLRVLFYISLWGVCWLSTLECENVVFLNCPTCKGLCCFFFFPVDRMPF